MKFRYYVEPRSVPALASMGLMTGSALLRLSWAAFFPETAAGLLALQVALPVASCLLFALAVLLLGKRALWVSAIPAVMGVVFFILKAQSFVWYHRLLCTLLYLAVAVLYSAAVFGIRPIRRLLTVLFAAPLAYHILVEDLIQNLRIYTAAQWLQEASVLCIMAALLCVSLAMKEENRTESPRHTCEQQR